MTPIVWQRVEGGLIFAAALPLAAVLQPGWPIWLWPLLLLAPDLSMFGYLAGPRIGAVVYNTCHLYADGLIMALFGLLIGHPPLIAAGALWLAHIGMDRALGYGLKAPSGFTNTHLGKIGKD